VSGESGAGLSIDYRGKRVLSAWRPIRSLGWGLITKVDREEAFLPIERLKGLLIVVILATIFFAMLAAFAMAKSISGPIQRLRKGTEIIGSGNLDYKIGIDAKDEIGQLSRAFDTMTETLKNTTTSVDDLNKEVVEHMKMLEWQQKINALQHSLLAPNTLDNKLKTITNSIVRIFNADFCRIWLIGPGDLCDKGCVHAEVKEGPHVCRFRDRCLHLLASSGRYAHIDGKGHARVPFGCYKIGRIASGEEHKFLTNDVVNDPRVHNHEWALELGLVSFAGYQLKIPTGETIGVLALFAKHPIPLAEDTALDSLSTAAAFVVQQAVMNKKLLKQSIELTQSIEELKRSQDMLIQSEKMASLGRIIADISHEVNNPLMIISSHAQLALMSGPVSAELKDAMELIIKECKIASNIMRRILKFARPSKSETKETDIGKSIEAVVEIIEKQFNMVNVKIERNYPEKPVLVPMDDQLVQEVFMNILNNAKEAMPGGGVITIIASLERDFLRIDFKDTGSGMSEEVKRKIFEPFFTTKEKGTGLGLSICYGIVKAHNGELTFESQLNKGTTATILLPLRGGVKHIVPKIGRDNA
jgi:signal transduction histidine kinase/HAMP domain-containing protein